MIPGRRGSGSSGRWIQKFKNALDMRQDNWQEFENLFSGLDEVTFCVKPAAWWWISFYPHSFCYEIEKKKDCFNIFRYKVNNIKVTSHPLFPQRAVVLCRDSSVHIICPANGEVITTMLMKQSEGLTDAAYAIAEGVVTTDCADYWCLIKFMLIKGINFIIL